jgi:hypothetical protein
MNFAFMTSASAGFFEFSLSASYNRTKYSEEDLSTNRQGAVSFAYRFMGNSAIEFAYSRGETRSVRESNVELDTNLVVDRQTETVDYEVYSVSWKQYLVGKRSSILPFIKAGYGHFISVGQLEWLFTDGDTVVFKSPERKVASGVAGAGLQIAISRMLHFSLAVESVFPKFKISDYEDRLTYSAGLSWFI